MKNKITVIVLIVILVLIGKTLFLKKIEEKTTNKVKPIVSIENSEGNQKQEEMEKAQAVSKTDDKMLENNSLRYLVYSKTALDSSANSRRVLFFYANWCPTCRPTDVNFKENLSKIPKDLTIVRINYNDSDTDQEEKDLAKKYNITYQHTFVQIDSAGKEITKWNGGQLDELLSNIK